MAIRGVAYHHLCHILLVRSSHKPQPRLSGRSHEKAWIPAGSLSKAFPKKLLVLFNFSNVLLFAIYLISTLDFIVSFLLLLVFYLLLFFHFLKVAADVTELRCLFLFIIALYCPKLPPDNSSLASHWSLFAAFSFSSLQNNF